MKSIQPDSSNDQSDHQCHAARVKRRRSHYQRQYAMVEHMRHVRETHEIIENGILCGMIVAVVRPDGQIGYSLSAAGKAALQEDRE